MLRRFCIEGPPIPRKRPTFSRFGTYDAQKKQKQDIELQILSQIGPVSNIKAIEGNISVSMTFFMPIPKSWSQKRRKEVLGKPHTKKPDIDNFAKMYLDALNGVVFRDDAQVAYLLCEKIYCDKPRTEITVYTKDGTMINEHALTVQETPNMEELAYLIRKANKLGLLQREIARVYSQYDEEGRHIYFEVEGPKK